MPESNEVQAERPSAGAETADTAAVEKPRRVLLVDDEAFIRELVRRWLTQEGYECQTCSDIEQAWAVLEEDPYPLVLTDITMPGGSGVKLLQRIRDRFGDEVAVLMATGAGDRETAVDCLRRGAYGYLTKPLHRDDVVIHIETALERRRLALQGQAFQRELEEKVREATADVRQREQEIIWRLLWVADRHDIESSAHFRRIGLYAKALAEAMGWSGRRLDDIKLASAMHDIGKIGVPTSILRKRGPLTDDERAIMQRHTVIGGEILGGSNIPLLQMASEIAHSHHERWDGSGYPRRLSGTDIPEAARIVAVVDVYDALGSDRYYRERYPEAKVLEMMAEERGAHFDPDILDAFFELQPALTSTSRLASRSRSA